MEPSRVSPRLYTSFFPQTLSFPSTVDIRRVIGSKYSNAVLLQLKATVSPTLSKMHCHQGAGRDSHSRVR